MLEFFSDRSRRAQCRIGSVLALVCAIALAQPSEEASPPTLAQSAAATATQAGYIFHLLGDYERAVAYYRDAIAAHPTAQAHTFLGWSLSYLGQVAEAIEQCKIAIALDPDFGNPYNDIGVYLIELGRANEAIPWLEQAIAAKRYCCYQYPHANLGRVLLEQGKIEDARRSFERALAHDPEYLPALMGLEFLKRRGLHGL